MSFEGMSKQTDKGLYPSIAKGGCLLKCLLATIIRSWSVDQVNAVYEEATKAGVLELNCHVKSYSGLLAIASNMRKLPCPPHLGRKWLDGTSGSFGLQNKNDPAIQFTIMRFATKWGTHFRVQSSQGSVYDPDPRIPVLSDEHTREDYIG